MQNVSDLPIYNSNTTWTIRISTGFLTGVACHSATTLIWDLMLKTMNVSNDFEISAIVLDQEGEYANILPSEIHCQLTDKGHTTKPAVMRTIAPLLT